MTHLKNFETFRKAGKVSVWVGDFRDNIQLDDYLNLSRKFETDFGFKLNERDMPETTVQESRVPILQLIEGFSWSDTFGDSVADAAKKLGIPEATTLVVFYNFEFDPSKVDCNHAAPLRFIGAMPFS